jgi:hypothetical protein
MTVEMDLHSLRWGVSADGVQARVMEAARRAAIEKKRWRRTWIAAAAILAICLPMNMVINQSPSARPDPVFEQAADEISSRLEDRDLKVSLQVAFSVQRLSASTPGVP